MSVEEGTTITREVADIIQSIADNHRAAGRTLMAVLAEEELRRCEVVDAQTLTRT